MSVGQDDAADNEQADGKSRNGWTTAERTTFGLSVVIIFALAAVAVVQHFSRPAGADASFAIAIAVDQAEWRQDTFTVPFTIRNVGAAGARELTVRFEVLPADGGEAVDELSVSIPVLPVAGSEAGVLTMTDDPATHVVSGRVESFLVP
ncbi:MAG: hypothetical protein M3464_19540 [Chloroflexota bacterium]|nr:hypothetical protein [Chloroflexota bacterium]